MSVSSPLVDLFGLSLLLSMASKYSVLPVEGKRCVKLISRSPRQSRTFLALLTSWLFLASLLGSAKAWTPARSFAEGPASEDFEAMIARATTGDQYLLGVGKADITG